jgi:hypothetical protein
MEAARRVIVNLLLATGVIAVLVVLMTYAYSLLGGGELDARGIWPGVYGESTSQFVLVALLTLEFGGRRFSSENLLRLGALVACVVIATAAAVIELVAAGTAWGFLLIVPAAVLACVVLLPPTGGGETSTMERALAGS